MEFLITTIVAVILLVGVVSSCPSVCNCTDVANQLEVDCAGRGLDSIPTDLPNNTYYLYLYSNQITSIQSGTFNDLPSLTHLFLYSNQITSIQSGTFNDLPSLTRLFLYSNQITSIQSDTFNDLPSLTRLYLYSNQITSIQSGTFNDLPSLTHLFLYSNQITSIQSGTFNNLSSLSELFLHRNQITSIQSGTFNDLPSLTQLFLYRNQITSIQSGTFNDLPSLTRMYLHSNQITSIQSGTFNDLPSLTQLFLHSNQITSIQSSTFNDLPSLTLLYLYSNQITSIQSGTFNDLPSLTRLILTTNQITSIQADTFNDLLNLNFLVLSYNLITSIQAGSFNNLSNLMHLYLNSNNITSIKSDTFNNLPNLNSLLLRDNPISFVSEHAFQNLPQLSLLKFRMHCGNCHNIPFWRWLKGNQTFSKSVTCSDYDEENLSSLQPNDFTGCFISTTVGTETNAITTEQTSQKTYGTSPTPANSIGVTDILKNLTTVDINGDNIKTVIETVKNVTLDPSILTSIDVIAIADVLVHIPNDTLINQTVVIDILDIINNVLNVDPDKLKKSQNDGSATNRLLEVVDTISHTLNLENQSSLQFVKENILMNVFDITSMSSPVLGIQIEAGKAQSLDTSNIQNLMADTNINVGKIDAAIILPDIKNSTRVAFSIYRNWNLFSVRSDIKEYLPNSRVMSASISVDGIPIYSLGQHRVQALFFPRMESENNECGYWDYDLHDKSGGWATSGCHLNRTEYGRHICVCDHLTNFAVLVNIGGQDTLVDSLAINIITWIGLILSIAGLSLTVLSFFLFRDLRKGKSQKTLFNLALSMLCFLIVFIVGIEQTHDFYGCIVVAALLHYFILVAFMWMLMEGILLYLGLVKVMGTYIPRFILKAAVPAWGVPLIPVVIVLGIDHELYYGGKKACWMSLSVFYYVFVIPVGIIILVNAIIFGMILKNLLSSQKGLDSNQSERKRAMVTLRAAFFVFVLLGLTWIFGFFTIQEASILFQYIFTILNVFQGFLIFALFTARDKKVRQNWKKLCCKGKPGDKYSKSESSSEMNTMRIRNNVSNSTSDTREVLT